MIDTSTIIEAVYYLLKRLGPRTKMELLKLVFLADKYHLIQYGRTVTGDEYFAMEYGPVGSTVKDVLDLNDFDLSEAELKLAQNFIENVDPIIRKARDDGPRMEELEMLSETDIEALDFAVEQFGQWTAFKLSEFTHRYPEWKRFEHDFGTGSTRREPIRTEDLLSTVPGDGIELTDEHKEQVRRLILGLTE